MEYKINPTNQTSIVEIKPTWQETTDVSFSVPAWWGQRRANSVTCWKPGVTNNDHDCCFYNVWPFLVHTWAGGWGEGKHCGNIGIVFCSLSSLKEKKYILISDYKKDQFNQFLVSYSFSSLVAFGETDVFVLHQNEGGIVSELNQNVVLGNPPSIHPEFWWSTDTFYCHQSFLRGGSGNPFLCRLLSIDSVKFNPPLLMMKQCIMCIQSNIWTDSFLYNKDDLFFHISQKSQKSHINTSW